MAEQHPLKKYRANCHCAAYIFEVNLPDTIESGLRCNCSYCYKRAGIFQLPQSEGDITFEKGDPATLARYSFGNVEHQFCLTCGTYLFRVDGKIYVNLRAIQNFNVWNLDTQPIEGISSLPGWTPPKFNGLEPPAEIESAKIYTGGCHCGAVTIALKSTPIDSTYDAPLVECNCSICNRNGYLWIYPSKSQVSVVGTGSMGHYSFGRGIWRKTFCRTCGVPIHNHIDDYTPEQIAALPEHLRQWTTEHLEWSPVNVRALDGVNLGELNVRRVDGWGAPGRLEYTNP
ncbi:Mss4-like protein [Hypoxylon crocopeplum]|nr:Mss4-like protein [Hypoxylon crocopeplum]